MLKFAAECMWKPDCSHLLLLLPAFLNKQLVMVPELTQVEDQPPNATHLAGQ
jgi:hypothetical protein